MRYGRLGLLLACALFNAPLSASDDDRRLAGLSKKDKVIWSNVAGAALISAWGFATWDYGTQRPHMEDDGWFGENDGSGGMDKLGHFYANYALSHGLSSLYRSWGYGAQDAALLGSLSAFGLMGYMEFGDSFGGHGFSRKDFIMNALGAITGYFFYSRPALARKIDFRVEYIPGEQGDIFTDYDNMKLLVALKLDGFSSVRQKYLKYLDLQLGYYTRHYSSGSQQDRERNVYVAVGINLSHVFKKTSYAKTAKFFNYYQMPYTYVAYGRDLNE
ncbi:MAG TPA: DUF2279 domain-containing protein [Gammaproteobacteria bacterium]|nr:DUF2279 domain-containing protein [Gammaproteobacteria bacterium]